VTEHTNNIK